MSDGFCIDGDKYVAYAHFMNYWYEKHVYQNYTDFQSTSHKQKAGAFYEHNKHVARHKDIYRRNSFGVSYMLGLDIKEATEGKDGVIFSYDSIDDSISMVDIKKGFMHGPLWQWPIGAVIKGRGRACFTDVKVQWMFENNLVDQEEFHLLNLEEAIKESL